MSTIKGTNVSSTIVPYTTDDTYPTHEAKYGKGGLRTLENYSDLDNIPEERKEFGMIVYIENLDEYYYLNLDNEWSLFNLSSEGDKSFVYNAHETTGSDTWTINHGLEKYPSITILDSEGELVIGNINYNNLNTVTISFSESVTGIAYLN